MNGDAVRRRGDGVVEVSGRLTFQTVPEYVARNGVLDEGAGPITVDMENVTQVDSAGVALMLEWMEQARTRERELRFINLNQQLRNLISVSGLDKAFGLA